MLSVILPASNEAGYIGHCLRALFATRPLPNGAEVIVVANGCRDNTAQIARGFAAQAAAAGWALHVLDLPQGGKPAALNAGDAVAQGAWRVYLDADVIVSPTLLDDLRHTLCTPAPRYASGTAHIPRARSALTRAYARFWQGLPFAQSVAPGYGLFATNTAGRARWAAFPSIISDDTFVRLHFAPSERVQVAASYSWPMIEGFARLVRVRRRQDAGLREIAALYPALLQNEGKARLTPSRLLAMTLRDPIGFAAYGAVSAAVRFKRGSSDWVRGR